MNDITYARPDGSPPELESAIHIPMANLGFAPAGPQDDGLSRIVGSYPLGADRIGLTLSSTAEDAEAALHAHIHSAGLYIEPLEPIHDEADSDPGMVGTAEESEPENPCISLEFDIPAGLTGIAFSNLLSDVRKPPNTYKYSSVKAYQQMSAGLRLATNGDVRLDVYAAPSRVSLLTLVAFTPGSCNRTNPLPVARRCSDRVTQRLPVIWKAELRVKVTTDLAVTGGWTETRSSVPLQNS